MERTCCSAQQVAEICEAAAGMRRRWILKRVELYSGKFSFQKDIWRSFMLHGSGRKYTSVVVFSSIKVYTASYNYIKIWKKICKKEKC